jgi:hypothetical protein
MFNNSHRTPPPPRKSAVSDNVVKYGRTEQATYENMAQALCMLDN